MTHNEINDWMSFYSLDRLQLVDLRCRNNPILEAESMDCARQILIATISSVVGVILEFKLFIKGFLVSDPLCLSSSSALHFFGLFFLDPIPCGPG
jgi:hypothetical protein